MAEQDLYSLRIFVDIALVAELICAAAANCVILNVFYRKPALLTIANRFIVNLTLINILSCVSLLPLTIADNFASSFESPSLLCSLSDFTSHFTASVIPFSVLLIAIDQYFAVVNPLHYHAKITDVKSVLMIASAWVFPLILSAVGLVQAERNGHQNSLFKFCSLIQTDLNSTLTDAENNPSYTPLIFSLGFVATSFILPFSLICFIYSKICAAASGNNKRTKTGMGHLPDKGSTVSCTESSHVAEHEEWEEEEDVGLQMCPTPVLTVTRPSPPRTIRSSIDLTQKLNIVVVKQTQIKTNVSLPNLKVGRNDVEAGMLRPFLPRNTSFCIPTPTKQVPQRRHSNVPLPRIEPDLIPKPRSLSKQSSFINSSRSSSTRIPVSRASSIKSTSSYLVSNLRHRLSNAGLFRYKERARAARVSALVIVMALLCWLPFYIVYILHAGSDKFFSDKVPELVNVWAVALLLVSTVASPALFAFRNRRIRKEIRQIFRLPVNELPKCRNGFSRKSFFLRVKKQAIEMILKLKPKNEKTPLPQVPK